MCIIMKTGAIIKCIHHWEFLSFSNLDVTEDEELTILIYLANYSFFLSDQNSRTPYTLLKPNISSKCLIR